MRGYKLRSYTEKAIQRGSALLIALILFCSFAPSQAIAIDDEVSADPATATEVQTAGIVETVPPETAASSQPSVAAEPSAVPEPLPTEPAKAPATSSQPSVSPVHSSAPTAKSKATAYPSDGYVNASNVNIRADAGTSFDIIGNLALYSPVTLTGEHNGWYSISTGDVLKGYIRMDFITVGKPPSSPQTTALVPLCLCGEKCLEGCENSDCPVCSKDFSLCKGILQASEIVPLCICSVKCTEDNVNSACPVCSAELASCVGIEQIDEILPIYEMEERELTYLTEDGSTVKVSGLLPTVAALSVMEVLQTEITEFVREGSRVLFAYDIKIMVPVVQTDETPTGEAPTGEAPAIVEYQPSVPVSVSITPPMDKPIASPVEVTHIDAENNAAPVEAETVDGTVEFMAEGFSIYIVTMGEVVTPRVIFSFDSSSLALQYCTTLNGTYMPLSDSISVDAGTSLYFTVTGTFGGVYRDGDTVLLADSNGVYTVDNIFTNTTIIIGSNYTLDVTYGSIVIGADDGSGRKFTHFDSNGDLQTGSHISSNIYTITGTTGNSANGGGNNVTLTGEGDFNVILSGVTIYTGTPGDDYVGRGICAPVSTSGVTGAGNINITLAGTNRLENVSNSAVSSYAALEKNNTESTLVIGGSGTLYAIGGSDSAGIGNSNDDLNEYGGTRNIIINSGTIIAESHGSQGAGIGSGNNKNAEGIRIYGGHITATGVNNGAGIGGSGSVTYIGGTGAVYIYGGTITAISNGTGAGIGGGGSVAGEKSTGGIGQVYIYGGDITTSSIGGGDGATSGGTATVNISGGKVTTNGSIGGGDSTQGSGGEANITITGGTISAANISGGHGAGGAHSGGTLSVTGGSAKVSHVCPAIAASGFGSTRPLTYNVYVTNGGSAVPNAEVTAISISPPLGSGSEYGLNDVFTDAQGRLYLWLPADTDINSVTVSIGGVAKTCTTTSSQAAASIAPAADTYGNIPFETTLTAVLSYGTPTAWRWEKLSNKNWISVGTASTFTPTVNDIGEIRVVINDTYTSPSVFILPPTISATVPLNVTVTVDASGDFTVTSSDDYNITNNSLVDIYLTNVTLAWDTVNAPAVFSDYTKLGAELTLTNAYSFGGGTMSQAISSANGKISKTGGVLPLVWDFFLNRAGQSGNHLQSVRSAQFATVTYTVSYIAS